jgi:hypothetical protein
MTPVWRRTLLVGAIAALITSFLLPAITVMGTSFNGLDYLTEGLRPPGVILVAFSANIVVPLLAILRPRWPRLESVLIIAPLAAAAWLTGRALVSPVQLHSGVLLWWMAMAVLSAVALRARA